MSFEMVSFTPVKYIPITEWQLFKIFSLHPAENTRTMCEIYSKLTIMKPGRCLWLYSDVFVINFGQILHIVLVFPLSSLNK